jgi:methylated-DNA-protein-cysteine methyltransferase related protein
MDRLNGRQELFELVRKVPSGRCACYSGLGRHLTNPVTGLLAGKWMAFCPDDVPWWRVAAKDGTLVIGRRDPNLGLRQRRLLEKEGVPFVEDRVDMMRVEWNPAEELDPDG